ncbi:hypothetical protein [Cellulomonas cellasea]|uniref:Glycosyl-4,4'-diaponeurosporenoate acyltransferase n=1 Tax=Cellulomonas cellasea TaxID=43670 RepID=A0A7W4UJL6_9CELL|nr:hypothetical protein [Cellulomonas cellasea]MBB2925332.1 hypothetical protein [Cellulomonas cellasea]
MPPRTRLRVVVDVAVTLAALVLLVLAWTVVEAGVLAWGAQWTALCWAALVLREPQRWLPRRRVRVGADEVRRYRRCGVELFGRALGAVGWNRAVDAGRGFDGTRATLDALEAGTRRSEGAHLLLLGLTVLLAVAGLVLGRPGVAVWSAVLAVPFHVYPVLLQRTTRYRLQRLAALRAD